MSGGDSFRYPVALAATSNLFLYERLCRIFAPVSGANVPSAKSDFLSLLSGAIIIMPTSYESCQSIAHELKATQRRANALIDEWQTKQPSRSARSGQWSKRADIVRQEITREQFKKNYDSRRQPCDSVTSDGARA